MTNTEFAWKNGPNLKSIEGGKAKTAGSEPPDGDWLAELPKHAIFLYHKKSESSSKLEVFEVCHKWDGVVLLYRNETPWLPLQLSKIIEEYHETAKFSQQNVFVKTLFINDPKFWAEQEQQKDPEHDPADTSNRPD